MRVAPGLRLDVRSDVDRKEDPFAKIMRAAEGLEPGQALTVINDFQPRLLYKALLERGFAYEVRQYEGAAWIITVQRAQPTT